MVSAFQAMIGIAIISAFYGLGITMFAYSLQGHVSTADFAPYQNQAGKSDLNTFATRVDATIQNQRSVNLIDIAGLVLFTGNFVFDLIFNIVLALPSFLTLIVGTYLNFVNIDPYLKGVFLVFIYLIGVAILGVLIVAFILGIRTSQFPGGGVN